KVAISIIKGRDGGGAGVDSGSGGAIIPDSGNIDHDGLIVHIVTSAIQVNVDAVISVGSAVNGGVRGSQRILIVAVGGVGVKSILDGVVPKICGSANRGDRDIAHGTIGEHNLAGGHIGVAVGMVVADAKEVLGGSR